MLYLGYLTPVAWCCAEWLIDRVVMTLNNLGGAQRARSGRRTGPMGGHYIADNANEIYIKTA